MLSQAAWAAIRVRGRLQARYSRLVRRFGGDKNPGAKKKAITAVAHTLLKIAYQVLKTGTPYQEPGADFYTRRESPAQRQAFLERSRKSCTPAAPSPSARRRPHYHPGLKPFVNPAPEPPPIPVPPAHRPDKSALSPSPRRRAGQGLLPRAQRGLSCRVFASLLTTRL
jgi:hypothetical protein